MATNSPTSCSAATACRCRKTEIRILLTISALLAAALWLAQPAAASDAQPHTYSPLIEDVDAKGQCRKGTSQCRMGGDCVERNNKCYSCRRGQKFNHKIGCYECPPNRTAFENGDDIVCRSNLRQRLE